MTAPISPTLSKIGLFHFVQTGADPFTSLEAALSNYGDVRDSLILLPEAVNYGTGYFGPDCHCHEPLFTRDDAVNRLSRIADQSGATFVAGLLAYPFSSAYRIDGNGGCLICHKKSPDASKKYKPLLQPLRFRQPS